jgi:predicted DNA-binding ribbon-helix-helix protein
MIKKSMRLSGHETSILLEAEFWTELSMFAEKRSISLATLVEEIDARRKNDDNLASCLRLYVLKNLKFMIK